MIVHSYASNVGAPNSIKLALLDITGQRGPDIVIADNFNTPFSSTDREKITKETSELNCTLNQMDLTEIYRITHPRAIQELRIYILLSSPGNFLQNIPHFRI
jgi:hypothetical protein